MHPAFSVIFFTTLSGAGYGLLVWTALAALLPELGYAPVNRYLPPRPRRTETASPAHVAATEAIDTAALPPVLRWIDRVLSR